MYLILTLHLTDLTSFLTLASQNAPLYLALTSVPTDKYGGSSPVYNDNYNIITTIKLDGNYGTCQLCNL